ncbi:MAG: hypoxanthine-guanine phosphoribosyltransferase [Sterolibacterium sp.]|nr:hypoxanthine-guanine phosphoribosyltransferase [Sterolibacterium sp.]
MQITEAQRILNEAELICAADEVAAAMDRLGAAITTQLAEAFPLVLTVMGGAVVFAGQLLTRLTFPLQCDYVHVSRYNNATRGSELQWVRETHQPVSGRSVLVLDDILDEGITLAAIKARLLAQGAAAVYTAVLADKQIGCDKPLVADFIGLTLPDRYVFGCGMDVAGLWRNLPAIYALKP